ncbi:putative ABC exporter domain-containing protein [Clostridium brassicae]|uniref:ABC transporter permease n=1 Tax=Clostridium brassicae TaxID=2999072 RepID=A0ABT4DEA4_9CLOT|nr:putative ABC exporter domain-containing protein [Clostridium brassicae]MCY6960645.1 hypothetical protein [Clostridium brassicae]
MWINDFKTLSFVEFAKFKNFFKYLMKNPVTAVKEIGEIIFPILLILFNVLFISRNRRGTGTHFKLDNNIVGPLVIIILFVITIVILLLAFNNYKPTYFTIQDVHYIFPSPINEKSLWAFNIVKSCIRFAANYFISVIFISMVILKFTNISIIKLLISLLGICLIVLFFKSLNFLLYSLKIKFNSEKGVKRASLITIIAMLLYLGVSFYFNSGYSKETGFINTILTFGHYFDSNTPVLTLMKNIIVYPINNGKFPLIELIFMLISASAIFGLAVFWGEDFYEDVSENIELNNISISTKNIETVLMEDGISTKERVIKDNLLSNIKGAGAFIYKSYLFGKRNGKQKRYTIICSILAIISLVGGYFARNMSPKFIWGILGLVGIMLATGSSVTSTIKYELKKVYIYLLPGSTKSKIFFITFYDYIFTSLFFISLFLPFGLMTKVNKLEAILFLLVVIFGTIMTSLSRIIVHFFIPLDYEGSAGILEAIIKWVAVVIPALLGFLMFKLFASICIVLISILLCVMVMIILILAMSEKFFGYIELR